MIKVACLKFFFIFERIKCLSYRQEQNLKYFWQGERGLEIDYIEVKDDRILAFECKLTNRSSRGVNIFRELYQSRISDFIILSKDNYIKYVS
jgi:predicted AAA+ superfamily ATPase